MAFFPRMFDPNPGKPEYADFEQEAEDLAKRKALADAMLNRGVFGEDRDQGRMVGNRWIRPSASEGIQRGIGGIAGLMMGKEATKNIADMRGRQQTAIGDWMKPLVEGKTETTPFQAPGFDEADAAQASQGMQTQSQRALTKPELLGHYMKGMSLGGPAASVSAQGMNNILAQQNKAPKYEIQERFNPETGRKEKVWVDMNLGPGSPEKAFGGQAQPDSTDALKKMKELVNMGMPQHIAEGIAYGYIRLGTNADGSTTLVNTREALGGGQPPPPGAGAPPAMGAPAAPLQPSSAPQAGGPVPVPQPGAPSPYRPQPASPGVTVLGPGPKPGERLSNDTEKLGKELDTKMVPTTLAGIKEVNEILEKSGLSRGGRGNLVGDVPGFGTIAGSVPAPFLSEEGQRLRGAAKAVANKLLQAQSGLAVTDQENRRFMEQLQQGTFRNDEAFLTGWNRVMAEVQGRLNNFKGAYHPDVINEYSKRNPAASFNLRRPKILKGSQLGNPLDNEAPTGVFDDGDPSTPGAGPNPADAFFK